MVLSSLKHLLSAQIAERLRHTFNPVHSIPWFIPHFGRCLQIIVIDKKNDEFCAKVVEVGKCYDLASSQDPGKQLYIEQMSSTKPRAIACH